MRFDEYWTSDLDFNFYVEDLNNQSVIERKWLQDLIHEKIKISSRGIILTAGMGYGKSSLISNLICAEQGSALHELKQSVLAYHMCRYDVKLSIKPEVFIRNLAGQLVKRIPEVGNTILSDDRALDFLYMKCAEDPTSCAEFSLFYPLKNLPNNKHYLIVIDALDECDTTGTYNLLTLIYRKMNLFPKNIRFIFTTRNIEQLVHKFKELERINLHSFEHLNANDLRTYIKQSPNLNEQDIDKLTEDSSGNFLYVKLKLQYCEEIGIEKCDNVPESLERIYSLNFERVFGEKGELFDDFIQLFEVLCSLQNPIEEGRLFQIAGFETNDIARKVSKIIGNELGHFIKFSLGRISFQHKSLSDFLTNSSRKHLPFYVNKHNGHRLFASYLLESLNLTQNDNLVEIAHHVALTRDTKYEDMLLAYASELEKERINQNYTYLYEAASEVNDYNTVRILIRLITFDSAIMENSTFIKDLMVHEKINMSIAAFIAAASGNVECVRAFFDYGALTNFTHGYANDSYHAPLSALYRCKYELFCGYNYMHIAAQRGHNKVVEYLVDRTHDLLHKKNLFNLTAFQLAAEHGHVSVMEVMLKRNKTLADQHSLHHASENGHLKVVNILLQYIEDACLPCNGSIHWRHFSAKYHYLANGSSEYTLRIEKNQDTFFDDKRLITCESALHAATRNGHFEIVSLLVNKSKVALNCELFDGTTPLITAVKFNRSEIFNFLYNIGSNHSHRCKGISEEKLDRSNLFLFELKLLVESACPSNGNIAHLIAIGDNMEMIRFLLGKRHTLLNTPDADGSSPLHYAFCHNSFNFVKTFLFEKSFSLNLTVRANNGSTPFHSAAICKSPMLHRYFEGRDGHRFNTIPDSLDNFNRTILQYGLSVPVDHEDLIRIDRAGRDEFTYRLLEVTLRSNHNFRNTDVYGRNFLHSAAQSGNYWAFIVISHNSHLFQVNEVTSLLLQKDNSGRNPFDVAFDALPDRKLFEPIKIPRYCNLNQVFFETCQTNYSILLSPHEYFILKVSQFLHFNRKFSHINLTDLVITSIKKSRLYPILILKTYARNFNVIFNSAEITHLVTSSNIPYLAEAILDIDSSLQCNGTESPLHNFIQNDRNSRWELSSFEFLEPLFKKYPAVYFDNCYDKEGYNLLHRAVLGGNLQTFQYLVRNGLNIRTKSRKNESVLEISIFKSPFMSNGSLPAYYNTGYRFHLLQFVLQSNQEQAKLYTRHNDVNFDKTSAHIFDQIENSVLSNRTQMKESLCDAGTYNLGLIHVAAAKGFLLFLQKVKTAYGVNILNCTDHYGITPLYLAKLYDQFLVVHWLKTLKIKMNKPKVGTEKFLIFNLLDNHNLKQKLDWICYLRYRYKHSDFLKTVTDKCIKKSSHFPFLYVNDFKHTTVEFFKMVLNPPVCDTNNEDLIRITRQLKNCLETSFSYNVQDLLNLLILFGFDDKEYYYQRLMSEYASLEFYTDVNPLTRSESKHLFFIVFNDQYSHLSRLKMRQDLHILWLRDKLSLLDISNLVQRFQINLFFVEQAKRSQKIIFPVELLNTKTRAFNKVCENLFADAAKMKEALQGDCSSCLINFITSLCDRHLLIKTNEDLHLIAFKFVKFITWNKLSVSDAVWFHMKDIKRAYKIDAYRHKVIELEILMKRTLRKISHLTISEKQISYIDDYRKYLDSILKELFQYVEYEHVI